MRHFGFALNMKKVWIFLLMLLLALTVFSGCTSFQKGDTTVVMKVGNRSVSAEMYRYVCLKNFCYLFGEEALGKELDDEQTALLEERVESELRRYFAVETLAEKYDVALSKDDKKEIKGQMKESKKSYADKAEYYGMFEEKYMTENLFYQQTVNYYLERNLFYHITDEYSGIIFLSDSTLLEDIEKYFYAAKQIYLSDSSQMALMEDLRQQILDGGDFDALMMKYSEDKIQKARYFTTGEMYEFFEEAVKALEVGEVSQVIESDMGLHLILRCPLDFTYVNQNLEAFRDSDLIRMYDEMIAEEADSLKISYTGDYTGLILS